MPGVSGLLTCACSVAHYIDHVIHWHVQSLVLFFFQLMRFFLPFASRSPLPRLCFLVVVAVFFFFPLVFSSVMYACSFLLCRGSRLGCAVVSVMGALFQSSGWLPIMEAPGYSKHPTSILAMPLSIKLKLHFILSIFNITDNVKTQRPGLLVR